MTINNPNQLKYLQNINKAKKKKTTIKKITKSGTTFDVKVKQDKLEGLGNINFKDS